MKTEIIKIKLCNGDIMTLPLIKGKYSWGSITYHQKQLSKQSSEMVRER